MNTKESLLQTYTQRKPLAQTLNHPARSTAAPVIPEKTCQQTTVTAGFRPLTSVETPAAIHNTSQSVNACPTSHTAPSTSQQPQVIPNQQQLSQESVVRDIHRTNPIIERRADPKVRKPRTCRKCHIPTCKGKRNVELCESPCQDCGEINCDGRNPKRKRTCADAWTDLDPMSRRSWKPR